MNTSITSGQEQQFDKFVGDTAKKALREIGLDKDGLQRIFERGDKLQSVIMLTLKEISAPNFSLLHTFKLKVPADYDHFTQLKSFREKYRDEFDLYNPNMTDKNFARVTDRLVPGKTYIGKFFVSAEKRVLSHQKDCLPFLKRQNAILCGAQGISLAWQCAEKEFPIGYCWYSLDKKRALWKSVEEDVLSMIPFIGVGPSNKSFHVGAFSDDNFNPVNFFCLCKPPRMK